MGLRVTENIYYKIILNILYNYDKNLTMKDESLAFNDIFLGVVLDTRILFVDTFCIHTEGRGIKRMRHLIFSLDVGIQQRNQTE